MMGQESKILPKSQSHFYYTTHLRFSGHLLVFKLRGRGQQPLEKKHVSVKMFGFEVLVSAAQINRRLFHTPLMLKRLNINMHTYT